MRRRDFISLVVTASAVASISARGQPVERIRRIGILENTTEGDRDTLSLIDAFRQRLRELGWIDGRNVQVEVRWSAGDANLLHSRAAELIGRKPDVLLGRSTPSVVALRQMSESIPIVFVNANDPIRFGLVQNLARPGGNITGFISWDSKIGGKWLEILKEIAPGVARVGVVYNPQTYTGQQDESLASAAAASDVRLIKLPFREPVEIEGAITDFSRAPNGGLLVLPDTSTVAHSDLIVRLATRARLPAIYPFRSFIASGGLAYYGTDTRHQYEQAAEYVDRILRGAKPADLPVQTPTKYEFIINLKTAKAIGLEIPALQLTRADEVIE